MDPFRRPANYVRLECPSRHVFGFAQDATGTLKVRCREKECRRQGHRTVHYFNLANGLYVTDYEPIEAGASERVPLAPPEERLARSA